MWVYDYDVDVLECLCCIWHYNSRFRLALPVRHSPSKHTSQEHVTKNLRIYLEASMNTMVCHVIRVNAW